jgi:hypothetical protein
VANREAILLRDEDQALTVYAKGGKGKSHFQKETHFHKDSHSPKRFQKYHKGQRRKKDFSFYQCYHCDKMGHIAKNCPSRREEYKKRNNKRHHACYRTICTFPKPRESGFNIGITRGNLSLSP